MTDHRDHVSEPDPRWDRADPDAVVTCSTRQHTSADVAPELFGDGTMEAADAADAVDGGPAVDVSER